MQQELPQQPTARVGNIQPGRNPRKYFDPQEMADLEASVRAQGVIQPISLRPIGDGRFEIMAGERRWRAAKTVFGEDYEIPATFRELDDATADAVAATENIQRANMSAAEEAESAAKILGNCNGDRAEAARIMGLSPQTFDKRLALLNCSPFVLGALTERKIQLGHAELLAAVTKAKQDDVLGKILSMPTVPAVPQLKSMLEQIAKSLAVAIFDREECTGCHHNSGNQRVMFAEAIADGCCTNGSCYDTKTEAALAAKVEALKETWPTVKIVRAGEHETIIRMVADGETGVGEEQAAACKGCDKFGAAVSAVPDKLGNVYEGYCFDTGCNAKKVAARLKAEKEAAGGSSSKGSTAGKSTAAKKAKPQVQDSQRVKDYREKVWREILRAELTSDASKGLVALLAIAICGRGSKLDSSALRDVYKELDGVDCPTLDPAEAAAQIAGTDKDVRQRLLLALSPSAAKGLEITEVVKLLDWAQADIAKHWKLNAEYLGLLTKSEIEVVADQIGLKAAAVTDFQKLLGGKKDDLIKGLLAIEGFLYAGAIPNNMRW